jgi:hypothetical protein
VGNRYPNLNPEKALIWRVAHRNHLPQFSSKWLDNRLFSMALGVTID